MQINFVEPQSIFSRWSRFFGNDKRAVELDFDDEFLPSLEDPMVRGECFILIGKGAYIVVRDGGESIERDIIVNNFREANGDYEEFKDWVNANKR